MREKTLLIPPPPLCEISRDFGDPPFPFYYLVIFEHSLTLDHQPVISILGDKSLADIPNPRLYRFKEKSMRFRFMFQYLPWEKNNMPDCMSRIYNREEDDNIDQEDYNDCESDNEVCAAISTCYIASVEEEYVSRCKEDDQKVTWLEIIQEGEKDVEYAAVKRGYPGRLP